MIEGDGCKLDFETLSLPTLEFNWVIEGDLVLETRLKISYFAMARSFGGNETQAKVDTQRVVGT